MSQAERAVASELQPRDRRPYRQVVVRIDSAVARKMQSALESRSPNAVMARFGISMNTWTKVRNGEPIRRSVAERLMARLQKENLID